MNQRDKPPARKIIKRIVIITFALFILLIATTTFMIYWHGSTKEIEKIANKFQPPRAWQLTSSLLRPPSIICLDGGTCPELARTWKLEGSLTKQQFIDLINNAGWNFSIDGDCTLPKNASGPSISLCSVNGNDSSYSVSLSLLQDSITKEQKLSMDIRPI